MFGPPHHLAAFAPAFDQNKIDKLDPMQNQLCRVCEEPAAGFHFGAFTCEGCKSFFGRTCNNQSVIQECKNNYRCVINKKNRTACKACRLRKCLMVGMSKSGSRYGRRSNWFKIHCLMQQATNGAAPPGISSAGSSLSSNTTVTTAATSNGNITSPPSLWRPIETTSPPRRPSHVSPLLPKSPSPVLPTPASTAASLSLLSHFAAAKDDTTKEVPSSTATALNFPLYSPFSSPVHFLPPTFNFPALSALPLHKQALLSPLLASSHILAAARKAYPFIPTTSAPSEVDILAEHKALIDRFRASAAAAAVAAAAQQNHNRSEPAENTSPTSIRRPHSSNSSGSPPPHRTQESTPIDLTKRSSSEDSASSVGSEIMPHLSDTDEEETPPADNTRVAKRKAEEMPLDLTCV